jgi:hypothetical protein
VAYFDLRVARQGTKKKAARARYAERLSHATAQHCSGSGSGSGSAASVLILMQFG